MAKYLRIRKKVSPRAAINPRLVCAKIIEKVKRRARKELVRNKMTAPGAKGSTK